jgi:hypothetical protein
VGDLTSDTTSEDDEHLVHTESRYLARRSAPALDLE